MSDESELSWFAVRCLFRKGWPRPDPASDDHRYEERITLWRTSDADAAIALAEAEAEEYASTIDEAPDEYLGLAQSYALFDSPDEPGAEVFSLLRTSKLDPDSYLDTFFDTGQEHQQRS
ncbi:hypothetical protein [Friedmanniella luteola]|uniref:hypothetical protein n=1 Tax=Friedmanniella luteola TaxID=546871 RepID=UPI0012FD5E69|nr:hypothetical protein [Friedmanniella luteola]